MINIVVLQDTLNPVSAAERVKVNQNWDAIRRGFSSLQNQIAFLSGGEDVDAIIQRIDNAIENAETTTQNAIDNINNNYAQRVAEINQGLSDLNTAVTNATNVTQATEAERLLTAQATSDARSAIAELMAIVNDFRNLGEYNATTQYRRNNMVGFDGRTYIALQDNINTPLSNSSVWFLFADRGPKGDKGDIGETGAALSIQGTLNDVSELPPTGEPGQAYTINGELYVWSENTLQWENVGNIKGEKGDRGEVGPQGPIGETPDLTPIENRLSALENQENTTKADVSGLNREVAYLKLRQDAADRIEGGTVFGDDFNGNRFGFTLNESASSNIQNIDGKLVMQSLTRNTFEFQEVEVNSLSNNNGFNSGRNLIILDNGWLVSVSNNTTNNRIYLSVSKDRGASFQTVITAGTPSSPAPAYYAIQPVKGQNKVVLVYNSSATIISKAVIDLNTNTQTLSANISTETSISDISLAVDPVNGNMHLCYIARDSSYPSSSNIKYSTSADNGSTFTVPVNLTTFSSGGVNLQYSSIAIVNGSVFIAFRFVQSGVSYLSVIGNSITSKDITTNVDPAWGTKHIYMGSNNPQERLSICAGNNGEIHVAWSGADADVSFGRIRYSHSSNGNNWTEPVIVDANGEIGVSYDRPSITCDFKNKVFITYNWSMGTSNRRLAFASVDNGILSSSEFITESSETSPLPATIYDPYYRYGFDVPPLTYISANGIKFYSNYYTEVREQAINSVLVYNVASTDYLGAFVKFTGNITVEGYINDTPLISSLEANEYSFEGSLDSAVPSTLRLELSRTNTTNGNGDALTRILGGRS